MRGIIRLLFFNNRCSLCDKYLYINSNKICVDCIDKLKNISSIKIKSNKMYLWEINEKTYRTFKLFKNKNSIVFKQLNKIIENKKTLLKQEESRMLKAFKKS